MMLPAGTGSILKLTNDSGIFSSNGCRSAGAVFPKRQMLMMAAVLSMVLCGGYGTSDKLTRFDYGQVHMGVRVNVSLYAHDQAEAEAAAGAAYKRFNELEQIMSDYRPDSELMLLCKNAYNQPIKVSEDLYVVLRRAQDVAERSDGAFDVTCGPLVQLWRAARKSKRLPSESELDEAKRHTGWVNFLVGTNSNGERFALLGKPGMRLDLGGIAKGYACDQALNAMFAAGVDRALVEAGGDMAASGGPPGTAGWPILVQGYPGGEVFLKRGALSTSGDLYQNVEIGGKKYSHIVDPRTGYGLTTRLQVSVLAPDGLTTDSLSTALSVMGEGDKAAFLAYYYGARAYFVKAKR
ncbi:MAG: FAD:protein FMN transferase [Armatimonadetes bacterium]|nr:FAD:protein FMN transferase [Armatimonadota bacterium]